MPDSLMVTPAVCGVCNTRPAIGVASTSMPMSVPYCRECAEAGADPESIFMYLADEEGLTPDQHAFADHACTWKDGKFMTYREWYALTHPAPSDLSVPPPKADQS